VSTMTDLPPRFHVVAFIDYAIALGGAETLAVQLLERLDRRRFRRTLVVYQHLVLTGDLREEHAAELVRLRELGVDVLELNRRDRFDLASWRPFLALLRARTVDVLHSHKFGPNLWAVLFTRIVGVPVVVAHEHTWSFEGNRMRKLADRWLIATGSDAYVAVSERDRERMQRVEHIPAERIRFLPNGIPAPSVPADQGEVREELGVPPDVPLIGSVGVFRAQKDFGTLVRAHALLLKCHADAHLVIVGDGPEWSNVEQLVAELGLQERVRLVGLRSDAVRLAAAFDVAVNSSLFEGSSLAVLEFMALARPIVATAVGGTSDLLAHGEAGVLVPSGDAGALAAAIGELLDDPVRARELGERARRRQREQYDLDVQVRRLEGLYEELLAAPAARAGRRWPRWRRARAAPAR
jgi:glycosyltransferase involved in cell wall biosynthesis